MQPLRIKLSFFACLAFLVGLSSLSTQAQNPAVDQQSLIAASQAGASPLYFYPEAFVWPLIKPSGFSNSGEFNMRDGLPSFFNKLKSDKPVTIGYLGGSITRADNQYRVQSAKFIQSLFPGAKITGINAGVSGTGADLGACRLHEQLLKYNPDLVFVEFAVNGAFAVFKRESTPIVLQEARMNNKLSGKVGVGYFLGEIFRGVFSMMIFGPTAWSKKVKGKVWL